MLLLYLSPGVAILAAWHLRSGRLYARSDEDRFSLTAFLLQSTIISVCLASIAGLVLLAAGELDFRLVRLHQAFWTMAPLPWVVRGISLRELVLRGNGYLFEVLRWKRALLGVSLCIPLLGMVFLRVFLFPFFLGGNDPGMYVIGGNLIARTGSIHATSRLVSEGTDDVTYKADPLIVPEKVPWFHRHYIQPTVTGHVYDKVPGWYDGLWAEAYFVADAEQGRIVPQFLHLWMIWIAYHVRLSGTEQGLWALPIFSTLAVLIMSLTAREVFGRLAAVLTFFFVGFNWGLCYFGRIPLSETCNLFFLWAGIYGLVLLFKGRPGPWVAVAPMMLALTLGIRLNLLYQLPVVFFAGFLAVFVPRPPCLADNPVSRLAPWLILGASLALVMTSNLLLAFPYTYTQLCYAGLAKLTPGRLIFLAVAAPAVVTLGWYGRQRLSNLLATVLNAPRTRQLCSIGGLGLMLGFLAWAMVPGYPLVTVQGVLSDWHSNEIALRFAMATGMPLLVAGVLGWAVYTWREPRDWLQWFLVLWLPWLWLVHGTVRASWLVVPYGLRYYATDLTPSLCIFAAYGVKVFLDLLPRSLLVRGPVGLALTGALLLPSYHHIREFWDYRGMLDTVDNIRRIQGLFPPDAVILFDTKTPSRHLMTPLHAVTGLDMAQVHEECSQQVWEVVSRLGGPVFLVTEYFAGEWGEIAVEPLFQATFSISEVRKEGNYRHIRWQPFWGTMQYEVYLLRGPRDGVIEE